MKFKYFISGGVPNLVKFSNNYTGCRNLMLASILEHSKYPEQYQNELVKLENSFNNTLITVKLTNLGKNETKIRDFFGPILENTNNHWSFDAEESFTTKDYNQIMRGIINDSPPGKVGKTYQMYFTASSLQIMDDVSQFGDKFSIRLVRGAYYSLEKKLNSALVYHQKSDTDLSYRKGLKYVLEETNNQLIAATHNSEDIDFLIEQACNRVSVAQLMGISPNLQSRIDQTSNLKSYLYVPYGPIWHCLPYLTRRLIENGSMVGKILD